MRVTTTDLALYAPVPDVDGTVRLAILDEPTGTVIVIHATAISGDLWFDTLVPDSDPQRLGEWLAAGGVAHALVPDRVTDADGALVLLDCPAYPDGTDLVVRHRDGDWALVWRDDEQAQTYADAHNDHADDVVYDPARHHWFCLGEIGPDTLTAWLDHPSEVYRLQPLIT